MGDEITNNEFAMARSEEINYFVKEPATIILENPEDSQIYLIVFYGEEK